LIHFCTKYFFCKVLLEFDVTIRWHPSIGVNVWICHHGLTLSFYANFCEYLMPQFGAILLWTWMCEFVTAVSYHHFVRVSVKMRSHNSVGCIWWSECVNLSSRSHVIILCEFLWLFSTTIRRDGFGGVNVWICHSNRMLSFCASFSENLIQQSAESVHRIVPHNLMQQSYQIDFYHKCQGELAVTLRRHRVVRFSLRICCHNPVVCVC
jgi:hypothetical protein